MAGVNKVILVGNLGKDPEVKYLEGGIAIAKFPLATTEVIKDKSGQKQDQTEWHNIVLWRGLAEIAEKYLRKGQTIYIEGKIRSRSYDDKDGNKRYITEIVGENMQMLGKRPEGIDTHTAQASNDTAASANIPPATPEDDLPF
jgi:single-strand DNA-binding protein